MNNLKTQILTDDEIGIKSAAQIIKQGGIVAFPTETVYGLGANAFDSDACLKIYKAKNRAADNPLIVHISQISQLPELVKDIPKKAQILAEKFWGGPLTLIMKKSEKVPSTVTCGMDTVAVRLPRHPTAKRLIELAGVPIAAPSANLSGSPSPVTAQHCINDLTGRADAIINGDDCDCGVESTILLMTAEPPVLLRPGLVTVEEIEEAIGEIRIDKAVLNPLSDGRAVLSPGLKYKHYSPKARVITVEGESVDYINYVNKNADNDTLALCFENERDKIKSKAIAYGKENDGKSQAHGLFSALRLADEMGAQTVFAHCPDSHGAGLAVMNRLLRAAGFEKIKV